MLEAKETGASVLKKKGLQKNCSGALQKKGLQKNCSGVLQKKGFQKFFQAMYKILNNSKSSAVLESRTAQFLRTWGFEALDFKMCVLEAKDVLEDSSSVG